MSASKFQTPPNTGGHYPSPGPAVGPGAGTSSLWPLAVGQGRKLTVLVLDQGGQPRPCALQSHSPGTFPAHRPESGPTCSCRFPRLRRCCGGRRPKARAAQGALSCRPWPGLAGPCCRGWAGTGLTCITSFSGRAALLFPWGRNGGFGPLGRVTWGLAKPRPPPL